MSGKVIAVNRMLYNVGSLQDCDATLESLLSNPLEVNTGVLVDAIEQILADFARTNRTPRLELSSSPPRSRPQSTSPRPQSTTSRPRSRTPQRRRPPPPSTRQHRSAPRPSRGRSPRSTSPRLHPAHLPPRSLQKRLPRGRSRRAKVCKVTCRSSTTTCCLVVDI